MDPNMPPLPVYTDEQAARRAELMKLIKEETALYHQRIASYREEIRQMELDTLKDA